MILELLFHPVNMNELENIDSINIDDLYNRIVTLIENAKKDKAGKNI